MINIYPVDFLHRQQNRKSQPQMSKRHIPEKLETQRLSSGNFKSTVENSKNTCSEFLETKAKLIQLLTVANQKSLFYQRSIILADFCILWNKNGVNDIRVKISFPERSSITFPAQQSFCPCRSFRFPPLAGCRGVAPPPSEPCWPRPCSSRPPSPAVSRGPRTPGSLWSRTAAPPRVLSMVTHPAETQTKQAGARRRTQLTVSYRDQSAAAARYVLLPLEERYTQFTAVHQRLKLTYPLAVAFYFWMNEAE